MHTGLMTFMIKLRDLFETGRAGLTVYSPDCTQSRLWGNLDHAIHNATGFQPIFRQWMKHDYFSLMRFYSSADETGLEEKLATIDPETANQRYDNVPLEELQYGHLFTKLLLSGSCLVTIWQGDGDVIPQLLKVKGKTNPAAADRGTIRGGFWCDNGICNLTHSSDNVAEVERELKAINLTHLLDEAYENPVPLFTPSATPTHYIAHSGIAIVCDVVRRLVMPQANITLDDYQLPPDGDAAETHASLKNFLEKTAQKAITSTITEFIEAYLAGDVVRVTLMMATMPLTKWENFVVQCGAINHKEWNMP